MSSKASALVVLVCLSILTGAVGEPGGNSSNVEKYPKFPGQFPQPGDQEPPCPFYNGFECAGHGFCNDTGLGHECVCELGYIKADCSYANYCPKDCSGHGQCIVKDDYDKKINPLQLGKCHCDHGF